MLICFISRENDDAAVVVCCLYFLLFIYFVVSLTGVQHEEVLKRECCSRQVFVNIRVSYLMVVSSYCVCENNTDVF